jgi:copper chaperone CopZ
MTEKRYAVTGMMCGHCAASIMEEVSHLAGISEVCVDLTEHAVTVLGPAVDDGLVRAAIVGAGYGVVREPDAA